MNAQANESKSNHKRQHEHNTNAAHDHDNPPEFKLQRLALSEQPINITMDLEHLDLYNLFNVAISNEYLRLAAGAVYKRKFGNKEVNIQNYGMELTDHGDWINVFGLNMCLQFIRCFGPSISNLCIRYESYDRLHYGWKENEYDQIHQHLNAFCAESLVKIEFVGKPNISIKHFVRPFTNVRTVRVISGHLHDQLPSLSEWFPNVRTMELAGVQMNTNNIKVPFHQLQDLRIDFNRDKFGCSMDDYFMHLLRMCYRLKSFKLILRDRYGKALNTLLNFIEGNRMLCDLTVSMTRCVMVLMPSEMERIIREHPNLVELNLNGYEFTADDAIRLIKQLDSLKRFSFNVNNQLEYERFAAQVKNSKLCTVSCDTNNHVLYEVATQSH